MKRSGGTSQVDTQTLKVLVSLLLDRPNQSLPVTYFFNLFRMIPFDLVSDTRQAHGNLELVISNTVQLHSY